MNLQDYLADFTARDWQASDPDGGPVRLAMVGLGWWVREMSIPAVADADLCETTVLVSRDKTAAQDLADELPGDTLGISGEEYHNGAATDHYDAVYVCTPNATHLPYVETAADLGKHVLCEKPMEASVDRAAAMVDAVEGTDTRLMVAYRMHTEPAVRRLVDLIDDGVIGEPAAVHGHMAQPLMDMNPNPDQWRLNPDMSGPGTSVMDIGLYPLNTARFVLDRDPIAVQATMESFGEAFADVPDERSAFTMDFGDGLYATCTASQNAAQSSHLEVIGTEGTARLDPAFFPDQARRLQVSRGKTTVDTTFDQIDQMEEEFDYFADCLLAGREFSADGKHGLMDMRVLEAVYEAGESGGCVEI
jgi:xylose dehydrogenase (NAD/NADP)